LIFIFEHIFIQNNKFDFLRFFSVGENWIDLYIFPFRVPKLSLQTHPPLLIQIHLTYQNLKHYHWFEFYTWLGLGNHSSMGRRNWKKKIPVMNRNNCKYFELDNNILLFKNSFLGSGSIKYHSSGSGKLCW